jgi:tRNA nucleotidyltransferase (CCA-adding enzyme)
MRDTPNNRFPNHFRDFINELNEHQVEYVLIGGYAMGVYGHYRGTSDLDIFINMNEKNAEKMVNAALAYGIPKQD